MGRRGWRQIVKNWNWTRGEGHYPIAAYSEFMPAPWIGEKPYGTCEVCPPFSDADPTHWSISEKERTHELEPGFETIGRQIVERLVSLSSGIGPHGIGHAHLEGNPYWPKALAQSEALKRERHLFLSPLALSKTQDDKGRVRWTLFGGSELGPARGFWQSFFGGSGEIPAERAFGRLRRILLEVFGETRPDDLKALGLRIFPTGALPDLPQADDGPLPKWTRNFLPASDDLDKGARYLLTFRPFEFLPEPIRQAYLEGRLTLLPSPGSLVFWGSPLYRKLAATLPLAMQICLLSMVAHHESPNGIRVPQAGWFHEPKPEKPEHDVRLGVQKQTIRRSHRWERVHRDDEVKPDHEDHVRTVLFSTRPDDVSLYGKPMARNAQVWSSDFHALLHGPTATAEDLHRAIAALDHGGSFGYRFFYPPMQIGQYAITWHRPLAAFRDPSGAAKIIDCGLSGFLTAADARTHALNSDAIWWPVMESETQTDPMAKRFGRPAAEVAKRYSALTFAETATRAFELDYWKTIVTLAEGRYLNKNNADCVRDAQTEARQAYPGRDLEALGDYLLKYYRSLAARNRMARSIAVGEHDFAWRTDFDFLWMGGWADNQSGKKQERNIVVVIPGKNRGEAVVMADHYDTAYMEDVYGYGNNPNGDRSRLAASGADDNHSATAALMLAAPIFLELSRKKQLERDIWLIHLTGEEFPSDCLGARHLAQNLIEQTLRIRTSEGRSVDLAARVRGLYVLDMIAHNNDHHRDIFQIAPGNDEGALWLGYQASIATALWNDGAATWNAKPPRKGLGRVRRSPHGAAVPRMGAYLALEGQVRLHDNPKSTLFNTDGQIFSDAGIPAVLFMENYDINRTGYHDSHDTMANIDLDYGSAVATIAIESVARAATLKMPRV
jgi:hypothetical protein